MILGVYPNIVPQVQLRNNQTNCKTKTGMNNIVPFGMKSTKLLEELGELEQLNKMIQKLRESVANAKNNVKDLKKQWAQQGLNVEACVCDQSYNPELSYITEGGHKVILSISYPWTGPLKYSIQEITGGKRKFEVVEKNVLQWEDDTLEDLVAKTQFQELLNFKSTIPVQPYS